MGKIQTMRKRVRLKRVDTPRWQWQWDFRGSEFRDNPIPKIPGTFPNLALDNDHIVLQPLILKSQVSQYHLPEVDRKGNFQTSSQFREDLLKSSYLIVSRRTNSSIIYISHRSHEIPLDPNSKPKSQPYIPKISTVPNSENPNPKTSSSS